jgi:hypothetical protein
MTPPMPSTNLVEASSSSPLILVFFGGLNLPKLQKPQNKTNTKKQIGNNSEGKKNNIKGKLKNPPLFKLGDGAHLRPKATKKKEKRSSSYPCVET